MASVTQVDLTGQVKGILPAANMPALTGDVTSSSGSVATSFANKALQSSLISDLTITSTDTVVLKTGAMAANRLVAGTVIKFILMGTCTSSAANVPTFTVRLGTSGTTADAAIASPALAAAATSGTSIPFRIVIEFTVRTTGSAATGAVFLALDNNGTTGLSTSSDQLILPAMSTFNTTTASNILSVTYKAAASTTSVTFKEAYVEFDYL